MKKSYNYNQDIRDLHGELVPFNISSIEKTISEFFIEKELLDSDEEFVVNPMTDEEIDELISLPESLYNKILPGYMYKVYGAGTLFTGRGGAQILYKNFLRQGMTEEMIGTVIVVHMDDGNEYPLYLLTIKK